LNTLVSEEQLDNSLASLHTEVTDIQSGLKGMELVQLGNKTHEGIEAVRTQQDQKTASIQEQTNRIGTKVYAIKFDDAGFGGQIKQLREELNADFQEALQTVHGERQMNAAALKKIDQVHCFTKAALTGQDYCACRYCLRTLAMVLEQGKKNGEKAKTGKKFFKMGSSHQGSRTIEPLIELKWTGVCLSIYN